MIVFSSSQFAVCTRNDQANPSKLGNRDMAQTTMNRVSGQIVATPSNKAISNLLVVLYDLDSINQGETADRSEENLTAGIGPTGNVLTSAGENPRAVLDSLGNLGDRIGSVLTDKNGMFSIEFDDAEFKYRNPKETRPDLFLLVMTPERIGQTIGNSILYGSNEIRRNSGRNEQYLIQIDDDKLKGLNLSSAEPTPASKDAKAFIAKRASEASFVEAVQNEQKQKLTESLNTHRLQIQAFKEETKRPTIDPLLVGSRGGLSVELRDNKVAAVQEAHYNKQTESISRRFAEGGPVAPAGSETLGMEVSFVLNAEERRTAGLDDPNADPIRDLSPVQLAAIRAKLNAADSENLVLTTDNPILRHCLERPKGVDEILALLGMLPAPTEPPSPNPSPIVSPTPAPPQALTSEMVDVMLAALLKEGDGRIGSEETNEKKADNSTVNENIKKVSLSKGPAEQTSFYDFTVLNIAFGHIWKQVIDTTPASIAATVKSAIEERGGTFSAFPNMNQLLLEGYHTVTDSNVPVNVVTEFDITLVEWGSLSPEQKVKLQNIADAIGVATGGFYYTPEGFAHRISAAEADQLKSDLREQGESLLDHVRSTNIRSLHGMLHDLDVALKSNFGFTVFGADETARAVNFGLLNTYRQCWEPLSYQVGDLVRSIPLAPKEERKYNVKKVEKVKRNDKEARKFNSTLSHETSSTGRDEEEIVAKAQKHIKFDLNGSYEGPKWKVSASLGIDSQRESQQSRKRFREAVHKATQELKEERSIDITVDTESEFETIESGTISNPNDELAVTYLFYELQKRFKVSEQLYRTMPVIMVAQDVPEPAEITDAWIVSNDWIINRVLLDDSFRGALMHLAQKSVGDDFLIRELRKNVRLQRKTVDRLTKELASLRSAVDNRYAAMEQATRTRINEDYDQRHPSYEWTTLWLKKSYLTDEDPERAKALEMAARDSHEAAVEKAENIATTLQRELHQMSQVSEDFSKAYREHLDKIGAVTRLKTHIKNNIMHYMHAIWQYEYEDQRFMRLIGTPVPTMEFEGITAKIQTKPRNDLFSKFRREGETLHKAWIKPVFKRGEADKPIEEVADLGTMLGCIGNYIVFPMKRHNALTEIMVMPYLDASFGAMDPDQLSNVSLENFARYVRCLRAEMSDSEFAEIQESLKAWLKLLLSDQLRNGDEIVVPTSSLYIEVMTSANTLMEDFKLQHRKMDVEKVRAEVLGVNIENLRKAKRIAEDKLEDPNIDKRITIGPGAISPILIDD
jgi:hypothetical protein